jgi:hypothetical protein
MLFINATSATGMFLKGEKMDNCGIFRSGLVWKRKNGLPMLRKMEKETLKMKINK